MSSATSADGLPSLHPLHRSQNRPHPSPALWGHLLRKTAPSQSTQSSITSNTLPLGKHTPVITPLDKAATSTRILLHDTQAHLEKFTERVSQLTTGLMDTKRELITVQKLYQEDHEQLVDRMISLANRCQTELQKTIGSPAQAHEVQKVLADVGLLERRVDVIDKKVDALSMLNHTQLQALQALQDQQSQILSSLLPMLPLLRSVPLHVENARDRVKDSISDLRQHVSACTSLPWNATVANQSISELRHQKRPRTRSRSNSSARSSTNDPVTAFEIKKRRLDCISTSSVTSEIPITPATSSHPTTQLSDGTHVRIHTPHMPSVRSNIEAGNLPDVPLSTTTTPSLGKGFTRKPPLAGPHVSVQRTPTPTFTINQDPPPAASSSVSSTVIQDYVSRAILSTHASMAAGSPRRTFSTQSHIPLSIVLASTPSRPGCAVSTPNSGGDPSPDVSKSLVSPTAPQPMKAAPQAVRHLTTSHNSKASTSTRSQAAKTPPTYAAVAVQDAKFIATAASTQEAGSVNGVTEGMRPQCSGRRADKDDLGNMDMIMRPPSVLSLLVPPPLPSAGKSMSLRDRRAMLPERVLNEGKRFIPLDDEEEEEIGSSE